MIITKEVAIVALIIFGGLGLSWVVIWLYDNWIQEYRRKKRLEKWLDSIRSKKQ